MARWIIRLFILFSSVNCALSSNATNPDVAIRSTIAERTTRYQSLLLKYFDWPRHPLKNDMHWLFVRKGIINEFEKILYKVPNATLETQDFETEILYMLDESTLVDGQNIIVTFHGRNGGTASDEIILIGAHYDSENSRLYSISDDGSGVVAILECVRNLADAIVNQRLELLNTVIFVAFDVQRSQYELVRDLQQGTGSLYYVNEKLSVILNTEPKPKFTGAIILDSIMNYNHSQNSQYLPHNFETTFPEAFEAIKKSNKTGNFLNIVYNEDNLELQRLFAHYWNQVDSIERYPLRMLEIRLEAASAALFEFYRQDHVTFWDNVSNGSSNPLPAILLTDTGKWRRIQTLCGTKSCKAADFITTDRLQMIDQVVVTIHRLISSSMIQSSNEEAIESSWSSSSSPATTASPSAAVNLLSITIPTTMLMHLYLYYHNYT